MSESFGYSPSKSQSSAKGYVMSPPDWYWLFAIMSFVVSKKGNLSTYTSRDGNAMCISIKHGQQNAKYWIGPDDDARDVLVKIRKEWNIPDTCVTIVDDMIKAASSED